VDGLARWHQHAPYALPRKAVDPDTMCYLNGIDL
jgi:hypothetical protein